MIERFGLLLPAGHPARKPRALERGEIRPTNLAPIITGDRELTFLPWGFQVSWQNQPLINARAETLAEKATFRKSLEQRCLVPASAYFEWRKDGKLKIKTRIRTADAPLFAFAGLIDEGRFTIVTCAPAGPIAHIHDRMPVVLSREAETQWLDRGTSFEKAKGALVPFAGALAWEEPKPERAQADLFS